MLESTLASQHACLFRGYLRFNHRTSVLSTKMFLVFLCVVFENLYVQGGWDVLVISSTSATEKAAALGLVLHRQDFCYHVPK